jgi:hypothetical protein
VSAQSHGLLWAKAQQAANALVLAAEMLAVVVVERLLVGVGEYGNGLL